MRRTLRPFDNTGMAWWTKSYNSASRKKMAITDQLFYLTDLVIKNPGMYLTEMKKELHARGINVDESTICWFLKEANETS